MADKEPKTHPSVKVGSALGILALAANQAGFKASPTIPETASTNTVSTLTIEPPTQVKLSTPTATTVTATPPPPEETATIEPTESWKIPTKEEIELMLADPGFFTEPQGPSGRIIITNQFNDKEYERLDPQLLQQNFESANYKGNSCGEAVIATLYKMFKYFETGDVPDFTIADVINQLIKEKIILPNGTNMNDYQLKGAIDYFGQQTGMFSPIPLTRYCGGGGCTSTIPGSEWSGLFKIAQKSVLNEGGALVAFVQKGGNPPGSVGHFIIISSFNRGGEPLIVDSLKGVARVVGLGAYVDAQPGLLSLTGVIPTSK
jgi:hypothetical protein